MRRPVLILAALLGFLRLPGSEAAATAAEPENRPPTPSPAAAGQRPTGTRDALPSPDYGVLLGRPTESSIAISLLPRTHALVYHEYGTEPGIYPHRSPSLAVTSGVPSVTTLTGLQPDRRYFYRTRHAAMEGTLFAAGPERTFHTQRARGSTFRFVIEADPHHRDNNPEVWQLALDNMLADEPDFLVDLGDTFMEEKIGITNAYFLTRPGIFELHDEVRTGFFERLGHSVPCFLVNGNHEAELGWLHRLLAVTNNPAVWGAEARRHFFPVPAPGTFYSGATTVDPHTPGPRDGYYAFEWGDLLVVVLDPFWYTSPKPQRNGWSWTLGREQYDWLKRTLEGSAARFKVVFTHHLVGGSLGNQARGGLTHAPFFEWGGRHADGNPGFAAERPGWPAPIVELLVRNRVPIVFHGHDHVFAKEDFDADGDGVTDLVYQEVPQPSRIASGANQARRYGYTQGTVLGNSGHLRVTVSPTNLAVEYVRVLPPANETPARTNRLVSYRYDVPAPAPPSASAPALEPATGRAHQTGGDVSGVDAASTPRAPTRPNIILLLADDQEWNGLSVPMHPDLPNSRSDFHRTPNLERLASQGMRFSAAYAPAPVCSPTRISLQTGKSPARLGWTKAAPPVTGRQLIEADCRKSIRPEEITVAEMLRTAGYATAHLGKWHLGGGGPAAHGYDESDGDTSNRDADRFVDPNPVDIFGMGERAEAFMANQSAAGKPFYLQMSYHALHRPENALRSTREFYAQLPPGRLHRDVNRAAITTDLDTGIGRLLEAVDRLGIGDRTYIVYLSDNGAGGGGRGADRPLSAGKGGLWEGGIRVPFIVRGPGVPTNSWCQLRVVGYDLFPTFCRWAGVTAPLPGDLEGGDLAPLLAGSKIPVRRPREELVFHFPHYQGDTPHSAILSGPHKLIKFYETGECLLFDLDADLAERRNLAPSQPELARRLEARLDAHLREVGARMPRPNPDFASPDRTAPEESGTGRRSRRRGAPSPAPGGAGN